MPTCGRLSLACSLHWRAQRATASISWWCENTEGEYAQVGGFVYHLQPEEIAIQTSVFTRRGIDRIVRFAFELAVKRNKKRRVTSITKSNAQGYSMVLWDRAFQDTAAQFPEIETESLLVDAAAMNFIRRKASTSWWAPTSSPIF